MGEQIYEERLKSVLEPGNVGRVVAIHVPSRDYFIGDSILDAADLLRKRHPNAGRGEVYTRGIGERAVLRSHTPRIAGSLQ
jgi:hypothetical protein